MYERRQSKIYRPGRVDPLRVGLNRIMTDDTTRHFSSMTTGKLDQIHPEKPGNKALQIGQSIRANRVALRIDHKTVIYVRPDQLDAKRKKYGL